MADRTPFPVEVSKAAKDKRENKPEPKEEPAKAPKKRARKKKAADD